MHESDPLSQPETTHESHSQERVSSAELQAFQSQFRALTDLGMQSLDDVSDGLVPDSIGRFEIQECIGSGTFGSVYLAFDPRLTRNVAVKIAHLNAYSNRQLRSRFLREAHAAARLAHQNVVILHEYGEENGLLYLVYEMCDGPTLEHWMSEQPDRTTPRQAVRLVRELASGLAHAHSRGLVHRDVKPGNILLQPRSEPTAELPFTPRITDFGLAHDLLDRDNKSVTGLVGTIDYMAPEQARGEPDSIQPASDLYSLGVILYRLLTGVLPFKGENVVDTLQRICTHPPAYPRSICSSIPRDLESICLKCLSKSPEDRYASCEELERDLGRFLRGLSVSARPLSKWERGVRIVTGRPVISSLITAIIVVCMLSAGIFWKLASDLTTQRAALQQTLDTLVESQAVALAAKLETEQALSVAELKRDEAERQKMKALQSSYRAEVHRAYEAWNRGQVLAAVDTLEAIRDDCAGHLEMGSDWKILWSSLQNARRLSAHTAPATEAVAIAGTDLVLSAGHDGRVRFHDIVTGELKHTAHAPEGLRIDALAVSSNKQFIAVGYSHPLLGLGHVRVYRLHLYSDAAWLGDTCFTHFAPATVESLEFSADSTRLAVGPRYEPVTIYAVEEGKILCEIATESRNRAISFSPDGLRCLVGCRGQDVIIAASDSGTPESRLPCSNTPQYTAWSPRGDWIAIAGYNDNAIALHSVDNRDLPPLILEQEHGYIEAFTFSQDGSTLAAGTRRGALVVWKVPSDYSSAVPQFQPAVYSAVLHNAAVHGIAMLGNERAVSVGENGSVIATVIQEQSLQRIGPEITAVTTLNLPDGEAMIVGTQDGRVLLRSYDDDSEVELVGAHAAAVQQLSGSPDKRYIGIGWNDGRVAVVDRLAATVTECSYQPPRDETDLTIRDICFSPDSNLLVACGNDNRIRTWQLKDCRQPSWEHRTRSKSYSLCFIGPQTLAVGGVYEEIVVMDALTGQVQQRLPGISHTQSLVYDARLERLISGHDDGKVRIHETHDFRLLRTLDGDGGQIQSLLVTPAGDCYLTGDSLGMFKVWRADDGELVGTIRNYGPTVSIESFEFCPNCDTLVVHNCISNEPEASCHAYAFVDLPIKRY